MSSPRSRPFLLPCASIASLTLCIAGCSSTALQSTDEADLGPSPSLDLQYGKVDVDGGALDDLEPAVYGLQFAHPIADGPFSFDIGFHYLEEDEIGPLDVELAQYEANAGLSLQFAFGDREGLQFVPYVGAGGVFALGEVDALGESETEDSFGYYGRAGLAVPIADSVRLGVEYRIVREVEYDDFDVDHDRIVGFVGFAF
jgi:hypothetical protein